jgi:tetratricopeptide (TPR) repeat protein
MSINRTLIRKETLMTRWNIFIICCTLTGILLTRCQSSTCELSKDPSILTKEFDLDQLRLYNMKLGDSESKIPQAIITDKDSGWIQLKGDAQVHIVDGTIREFKLERDFLRRLGVASEDHVQSKIGSTETIVEFGLFGKTAAKFYIYPSKNMAIEWHRVLDGKNNCIVIGPSVTKRRYEERLKEQNDLNSGIDQVEIYEREGRYDEAIELLEKLIELQPENPFTRSLLGKQYYSKKEYDKAEREFNTVISMYPDSRLASKAYLGLSWIYMQRKEHKK